MGKYELVYTCPGGEVEFDLIEANPEELHELVEKMKLNGFTNISIALYE